MTSKVISKIKTSALFTVLITLLMASTGFAATYYVDKNNSNASDNNPGTSESAPWATFTKAAGSAKAGDTVYVKDGIYYEAGEIRVANSGTSAAPITFTNFPGHSPILDGSNTSAGKFLHLRGVDYVIIDGFEIRDTYQYAVWVDGSYNIIRNSKVHLAGRDGGNRNGITLKKEVGGGEYNTITGNELYDNSWNGLSVESCNFTTISWNKTYRNGHQGINVFPNTATFTGYEQGNDIIYNTSYENVETGIYTRYQKNNLVANNLVYNNKHWGIFFASGGTGSPGTGNVYAAYTQVYNNTIVNNEYDGLYLHTGSNVTVKNNIFYRNNHAPAYPTGDGKANVRVGSLSGCVFDNNFYVEYPNTTGPFYYNGDITLSEWQALGFDANIVNEENPAFANINSLNFRLTAGSKAIDAGANLSATSISVDLDGNQRISGSSYDIGAYEFNDGATLLSPPKNLRIN